MLLLACLVCFYIVSRNTFSELTLFTVIKAIPHQSSTKKCSTGLCTGQSGGTFSQLKFTFPNDSSLCQIDIKQARHSLLASSVVLSSNADFSALKVSQTLSIHIFQSGFPAIFVVANASISHTRHDVLASFII